MEKLDKKERGLLALLLGALFQAAARAGGRAPDVATSVEEGERFVAEAMKRGLLEASDGD